MTLLIIVGCLIGYFAIVCIVGAALMAMLHFSDNLPISTGEFWILMAVTVFWPIGIPLLVLAVLYGMMTKT